MKKRILAVGVLVLGGFWSGGVAGEEREFASRVGAHEEASERVRLAKVQREIQVSRQDTLRPLTDELVVRAYWGDEGRSDLIGIARPDDGPVTARLIEDSSPSKVSVSLPASPEGLIGSLAPVSEPALSNIVFHFQLIQAEDGAPSDPRIAEVEAALQGFLRFTGYRLVGDGMVQVAGGGAAFSHILSGAQRLHIFGEVTEIRIGNPSYARVENLMLMNPEASGREDTPVLLQTTLNVRHGQVVVVGSVGNASDAPMFLTVKADIDPSAVTSLPLEETVEEVVALGLESPAKISASIRRQLLASGPSSLLRFEAGNFNRIEGLPLHIGPSFTLGNRWPTQVEASLTWRSGGKAPFQTHTTGYEVGVTQHLGGSGVSFGGEFFSRISPISEWGLSPENSLSTFLFSLDQGDYFETRGGRLFLGWSRTTSPLSGKLNFTRESIGSIASSDPWSLLHSDRLRRDQPLMAEGSFPSVGAEVTLDTRNNPESPTTGWFAQVSWREGVGGAPALPEVSLLDGDEGDSFGSGALPSIDARPSTLFLDIRKYTPIASGVWLNVRGVLAGSPTGDQLPSHLQHTLGGLGTLPGHTSFAADCGARDTQILLARDGVERTMYPYFGCDQVALFQAEYRGTLKSFFGRERASLNQRERSPSLALFFDAGKGWASPGWGELPRSDSPLLLDAGVGLLLGKMGLYWAKPFGDVGGGSTLTLRFGRRF